MDTINVLLAAKLKEVLQRQIADVDKRVKVCDAADLVEAEVRRVSQVEVSPKEREELDNLLREAEVILMPRPPWPSDMLSRLPKAKWVQYIGAGVDRAVVRELVESDLVVTNSKGTQNIPMAEYILATILMFVKKALLCFLNKQQNRWEKLDLSELWGKTLGIVGLGSVGQEVARLAKAFGMRIVATRRSVVRQEFSVMGVDKVYPPRDLPEMLGECDFVVLLVPLIKETTRMIGERELRAMKLGAFLINSSRGGVIDEGMLIRALREGWIAGAALDVFQKEPLSPESALWEIPNVFISPHVSARSEMRMVRLTELFCENLKRYLAGQPLLNVIDKVKGY